MSETPARSITWEDVSAMYRKLEELLPPRKVRIIGRAPWDAMLAGASEEHRAVLLSMEESGDIVISEFVPDNTVYEFNKTEYERRLRGE